MPCVPVAVAPAIDCLSMSPRFSKARPCASSAALSWPIVIPASTRTSPLAASTSSTRFIRSSEISVPSVGTSPVNECPEPATRTCAPACCERARARRRARRCRAAAQMFGDCSAGARPSFSRSQLDIARPLEHA